MGLVQIRRNQMRKYFWTSIYQAFSLFVYLGVKHTEKENTELTNGIA